MSAPFPALVQQAYRAADLAIQRGLKARGFAVSTAHSAVLANIDIASGTRATTLAERASVTKQAMGELIDDLEAKDLVRRVPDPRDGRAKLIQLTAPGQVLMDAAYEVIGEIEGAVASRAGADDLEAAKRTLQAMVEILS